MNATAIDHVNLRVPEVDVEAFVECYRDDPGFDLEHYEEYRAGEQGFFFVRLGRTASSTSHRARRSRRGTARRSTTSRCSSRRRWTR